MKLDSTKGRSAIANLLSKTASVPQKPIIEIVIPTIIDIIARRGLEVGPYIPTENSQNAVNGIRDSHNICFIFFPLCAHLASFAKALCFPTIEADIAFWFPCQVLEINTRDFRLIEIVSLQSRLHSLIRNPLL